MEPWQGQAARLAWSTPGRLRGSTASKHLFYVIALLQVESASVLVVPLGTHTAPGGAALLLPPRMSKLPGPADVVEGALVAESPALSRLVRH